MYDEENLLSYNIAILGVNLTLPNKAQSPNPNPVGQEPYPLCHCAPEVGTHLKQMTEHDAASFCYQNLGLCESLNPSLFNMQKMACYVLALSRCGRFFFERSQSVSSCRDGHWQHPILHSCQYIALHHPPGVSSKKSTGI